MIISAFIQHGCSGRFILRLLLAAVSVVVGASPLFAAAPANDSFAGQPVLVGSTNSVSVSSVDATGEAGEPSHAGNAASASVWWTWIAPDNGLAIIDTLGSSFDTVLAIYTGDAFNALSLVDANDDAPGLPTSLISFPAIRGTQYRIAVDGFSGLSGDAHLRIRLPVAPSAPAITTQPVSQTVSDSAGSNVTFAVAAAGSFPLVFQWQKEGGNIAGATNASVTLSNATLAAAGNYRVVITNSSGSITSSVAALNVLATLGNDLFAGRVSIIGQNASVFGHNVGASMEAGEPLHAGVAGGVSLWWTWTAPQNGLVRLDTVGSSFDTVLAVYTGASVNSLASVAANNDEIPGQLSSSKVFFRAVTGVTYHFAVAGVADTNGIVAVGDIALNLTQSPDNDFFANALFFASNLTSIFDNNTGATTEPGEPSHPGNPGGKSVWWIWIAPSNGTYVVDTAGSVLETVLGIYTGNSLATLAIVGVDDSGSEDDAASVKFFAIGGTTYFFSVAGYSGTNGVSQGAIVLNVNPSLVLNDAFAERVTLSGQTNHVTGSNLGATKELGEPEHGANAGGRSVWWTWTAHIDGPVVVTTRNSDFDTVLAVYAGTSLGSLTLIAENDDTDLVNPAAGSVVVFPGVAGQTYQIAVDGYRTSEGTVAAGTVQLTLAQINPVALGANDLFVNRVAITGQSNHVFGLNTNATEEVGEPSHAGNDGGKSLWWSWIAPATAPVRIDTIGSGFETILGVYQGANVGALTVVASDERSAGNGHSAVTFEAVEGVEYQIAVDGFNNGAGADSGRVVLNLYQFSPGALHANDDFEHASPISEPFLTVNGSNIGANRQSGEPAHATAPTGRSVWWTWTAQNDGPVTISTTGSQFDTILGVYTGASVDTLSLVAENDDIDPGDLQSRVTFQASAGTVYRIAVDGYGNQIGLITLTVSPGADTSSAPQIQQAPADQTRFSNGGGGGTNAGFRVVATGSLPLSYQWLRNGAPVTGATNDLLTVSNAAALTSRTYSVVVSNAFGVVTSAVAELTVVGLPFNDAFADAIAISGTSNLVRGSILGASKQPNEPHHGGEIGGRSVWWTWTAPANGPVEIHTLGSSFDTLLGVYTGNAADSLNLVADDDDIVEDVAFASGVVFNAVAGQQYRIAVDGTKTNYTAGSVVLTLRQSPPPLIVVQPRALSMVHSTNTGFSLGVTISGPSSSTVYQWRFNGIVIPGATNSTYVFGTLSRTNGGVYSVAITNEFGGTISGDAVVRVLVPQRMLAPQRLPDGRVRILFSDPDGTLAPDPGRFEVQHTSDLGGSAPIWTANPGTIVISDGRYLFEEQSAGTDSDRFYRIAETQ